MYFLAAYTVRVLCCTTHRILYVLFFTFIIFLMYWVYNWYNKLLTGMKYMSIKWKEYILTNNGHLKVIQRRINHARKKNDITKIHITFSLSKKWQIDSIWRLMRTKLTVCTKLVLNIELYSHFDTGKCYTDGLMQWTVLKTRRSYRAPVR